MVGLLTKMRYNYRKNLILIYTVLGAGTVLVLIWVILNRAWVGDDAYITFRVVDNFLNGYELRWNVQERVQVFTHPLWFWIISLVSAFSGEVYLTSIFVGVSFSVVAAILLLKMKKLTLANSVGVFLLSFSGAYVDYSTSGLENSLTHLILVLFAYVYLKKGIKHRFFFLALLCGLAGLNRLDLVLFFIPALGEEFFTTKDKKKAFIVLVVGTFPAWGWLLFSFFYFGFPFPNTFYAKMNHWLTVRELINQGLIYLSHTLLNDPVTGIVIIIGGCTTFIHRSKKRTLLSVGALLYLGYVIWIGGDFMEGRFLTGIFLMMVIELIYFEIDRIPLIHYGWIVPMLLVFNFYGSVPTFVASSWDFVEPWQDGVVNERAFYWSETGLFRDGVFNHEPGFVWVGDGRELSENSEEELLIVRRRSVGFVGYYGGPNVYLIDELGLGNALLSRIPARRKANWRIGHFERVVPDGYPEYLRSGELLMIKDKATRSYIEVLDGVISSPLLSVDRLNALVKLNLGVLDEKLNQEQYIYPKLIHVNAQDVSVRKVWLPWNEDGNIIGFDSGIFVTFDGLKYWEVFEASFAQVKGLEVHFLDVNGQVICIKKYELPSSSQLRAYRFEVPEKALECGYSSIHFLPTQEKPQTAPRFSFGHIILYKNTKRLTF